MAWNLEFSPTAEKELSKLDPAVKARILKFLFNRVAQSDDPKTLGEPLQGSRFEGAWRFRVGDYRIVVRIYKDRLLVMVVEVGHRREVYR
jgi:mRNA interferase RelE/StbE